MLRSDPKVTIVNPFPVRCVDAEWPFETPIGLTEGKSYMVVATKGTSYQICNDEGEIHFYDARRFEFETEDTEVDRKANEYQNGKDHGACD